MRACESGALDTVRSSFRSSGAEDAAAIEAPLASAAAGDYRVTSTSYVPAGEVAVPVMCVVPALR